MPPPTSTLPTGTASPGSVLGVSSSIASFTPADALDGQRLQTIPEGQVAGFLFNAFRTLRAADIPSLVHMTQKQKKDNNDVDTQEPRAKEMKRKGKASSPSGSSASLGSGSGSSAEAARTASPEDITAVAAQLRSFVKSLLTVARYTISHATLEVAQLVACVLCDCIRLYHEAVTLCPTAAATDTEAEAEGAHGSAASAAGSSLFPVPFPLSASVQALRLLAHPFRLICEANHGALPGAAAGLHRCGYLVERAAASHALRAIIPGCLKGLSGKAAEKEAAEVESTLQSFFSAVTYAQGEAAAAGGPAEGRLSFGSTSALTGLGTARHTWSATSTAEMARLLGDILSATNSVTADQLAPLLRAVIAASSALRGGPAAATPKTRPPTASGASGLRHVAPSPAAMIAGRVFLEQIDVLQPAVASVALGHLAHGVEQLMALELHHATALHKSSVDGKRERAPPSASQDSADDVMGSATRTHGGGHHAAAGSAPVVDKQELQRRKRPALRETSRALEILTAMMELNVNLCVQLVPALLPYLSHELTDVRVLLFRGFVAAWMSNSLAFEAYPSAFQTVLHRFNDVKPALRVEAVEAAGKIIHAAATGSTGQPWPTSTIETVWAVLRPCVEQRLTDLYVLVRLQAVSTYADILTDIPGIASAAALTTHSSEAIEAEARSKEPRGLAATLGLRTADKNMRVRERAVERLSRLYGTHASYFSWIPDSVMRAVNADGGLRLVEAHIESMLPSPSLKPGHTSGSPNSKAITTFAVFDFEKEEEQQGKTFVDALIQLCRDMHETSFTQLLSLMKKKAPLRLTIARLFEFRAQAKSMTDPKSPEGQAVVSGIHRLLTFLQEATHAEKGEWDALFRAKDEGIARALQRFCPVGITNWGSERGHLLASLKGRLEPEVYRFVSESLAKQMALPVDLDHVSELLRKMGEAFSRTALQRRSQRRRDGSPSATADDSEGETTATATLRALLLLTAASPSFWPYSTDALLNVLEVITQTAATTAKSGASVCRSEALTLLLQCLREWAAHESSATGSDVSVSDRNANEEEEEEGLVNDSRLKNAGQTAGGGGRTALTARSLPKHRKHDLLATLGQLCLGGDAALNVSRAAGAGAAGEGQISVDTAVLGQLSRAAAQSMVTLIGVPAFGEAKALSSLVETLSAHLADRALAVTQGSADSTSGLSKKNTKPAKQPSVASAERAPESAERTVAWLAAVQSLAEARLSSALVQNEALTQSITDIFTASITQTKERPEHERLLRRGTMAEKREQLFTFPSIPTATGEAAAKALSRIALSYGSDRRRGAVSSTLDTFLNGYKLVVTQAGGQRTVGDCRRRLAVESQLVQLLVQPSADIGKELAVAVILSAEEEDVARAQLQQELRDGLLQSPCDMRYAAFLLLTAMTCDNKASYQELKAHVTAVGERLQQRQAQLHATLSDPAAMQCYLEYTIPFLILFMSHHTFYASEKNEYNFTAFQRVWHLLFEELFRHGTQCASFVVELLRRIKASDDILDRASDAHRVLCDLGSQIMIACLGQRQTSADTLKRFPGAVLLPNFFAKSTRPDPEAILRTAYADPSLPVAPSAPFRTLGTTTAAAGEGNTRESATPRQSVARARSQSSSHPRTAPRVTADAACLQLRESTEREGTNDDDGVRQGHGRTHVPIADEDVDAEEEVLVDADMLSSEDETKPTARAAAAAARGPSIPTPTSAARRATRRARSSSLASSESASAASTFSSLSGSVERHHGWGKRRRTTSTQGSASHTNGDRITAAVDRVLDELLEGLGQSEIAQLRWKLVKTRIEGELGGVKGDSGSKASADKALAYAREQLKVRYEAADP